MEKRRILFALALLGLAVTIVLETRPKGTTGVLAQSHSLRERARQNGGVVEIVTPPDRSVIHNDLIDLARGSNVIAVGQVLSNRCIVTPDEASVSTDYTISITEPIKGGIAPGATVLVSVPRGLAIFSDERGLPANQRTRAFVRLDDFLKPKNNGTYVLFLQMNPTTGHYRITEGPQGLFDISSGITVPASLRRDPIVLKYQKTPSSAFLDLVRAAARS